MPELWIFIILWQVYTKFNTLHRHQEPKVMFSVVIGASNDFFFLNYSTPTLVPIIGGQCQVNNFSGCGVSYRCTCTQCLFSSHRAPYKTTVNSNNSHHGHAIHAHPWIMLSNIILYNSSWSVSWALSLPLLLEYRNYTIHTCMNICYNNISAMYGNNTSVWWSVYGESNN